MKTNIINNRKNFLWRRIYTLMHRILMKLELFLNQKTTLKNTRKRQKLVFRDNSNPPNFRVLINFRLQRTLKNFVCVLFFQKKKLLFVVLLLKLLQDYLSQKNRKTSIVGPPGSFISKTFSRHARHSFRSAAALTNFEKNN